MPLVLDKVLATLAYPLGLALCGLLVALVLLVFRVRRSGIVLIAVTTALLWIASTPLTAQFLLAGLEQQYPAQRVEAYPAVDVAVVLGGGLRMPDDFNPYPDFGEASDRVFHAYRILKAGKARFVLLSGGNVFDPAAQRTEAHAMADVLATLGIAREAVLIEGTSRNTFENARQTAVLWKERGFGSGLLVTSSSHMPRALAVFRRVGMALEPAATDARHGSGLPPFPLLLLPDSESLDQTTKALKEWLGLIVYRWRGWA